MMSLHLSLKYRVIKRVGWYTVGADVIVLWLDESSLTTWWISGNTLLEVSFIPILLLWEWEVLNNGCLILGLAHRLLRGGLNSGKVSDTASPRPSRTYVWRHLVIIGMPIMLMIVQWRGWTNRFQSILVSKMLGVGPPPPRVYYLGGGWTCLNGITIWFACTSLSL